MRTCREVCGAGWNRTNAENPARTTRGALWPIRLRTPPRVVVWRPMLNRTRFVPFAIVVLFLSVLLGGCGQTEPMEMKAPLSPTSLAFLRWRTEAAGRLMPAQREAFEQAVQELRLKEMAAGATQDGIDAAVGEKVAGKTVREVIALGLGAKIERLEAQRANLNTFIEQNAQLTTKEGDAASANYLARHRDEQVGRRDAMDREIADVRKRAQELGVALLAKTPEATTAPATAK